MKETKLFRRDFTMVVIGQIISLFGNAILRFAMPLYLLRETGSAALFGLVTACSFLPTIVLSLVGGILADRVNKRNIMVILDFSTAALIAVLSLLLGQVPVVPLFIAVLMILYGIQSTYQPAVQASIPAIVCEDKLLAGNAVVNQISSLAGLLGPVAGGLLYGLFGIRLILGISIICFLISAVMEIFISIPYVKRKAQGSVFQIASGDLKESLHFVKNKQPIFFRIAGIVALFNMILSALLVVGLPVLLVEKLSISDNLFGISQGMMALGGLAGGCLAGILGKKMQMKSIYGTLLGCALTLFPIGIVFLIPMPQMAGYTIITAMSFICMAFSTVFVVRMLSYVQEKTPQELVGKVIAAILAICTCTHPIGQALYGVLFEVFDNHLGFLVCAAALAGCIIALASKRVFGREAAESHASIGETEYKLS